jgi:nucleotide-binding universal stress UspA family protein
VMSGHVVVGVTGTETSVAALKWAARLAAGHSWPLDVVTAWPDPAEEFVHAVPGHHCHPLEQAVASMEMTLARARAATDRVPVLTRHVENAHATEALLAYCDSASVLVLGASHTPSREGVPSAHVADACAGLAPCPVVVVDVTW